MSKKLSLDDESEATNRITRKSWRTRVRNGMVMKSKRHRNVKYSRKGAEFILDAKEQEDGTEVNQEEVEEEDVIEVVEEQEEEEKEEQNERQEQDDEPRGSSWSCGKRSPQNDERDREDDVAVENIAERIKKRKVNAEKKTLKPPAEADTSDTSKRNTRKRVLSERRDKSSTSEDQAVAVSSSRENVKPDSSFALRSPPKRQRVHGTSQCNEIGRAHV